jgi:hypothetical protein
MEEIQKIADALTAILRLIVDKPDEMSLTIVPDGSGWMFRVSVSPRDVGMLIDQGRGDGTLLNGCSQPQDLAELLFDDLRIDGAADHGAKCQPLRRLARHIKTFVRQVAYAMREAKAKQVTESKDVIGKAGGIGVVFLDPQLGLVIEQAIEHMRRVANGGIDDFGMEGCVLIGDVSVEGDARIIPIFRVHLASCFAAAARAVALAVGTGGCAFAPVRSERNAVLMVDDFGQSL